MAQRTEEFYKKAIRRSVAKKGDIVLCGYYGYGNTGDDALLHGALRRAKEEYPSLSVCALTARGRTDESKFGVRCVAGKSLSALKEIKNARLFVFGGGTLLQDKTSKRSLIYYLFLLRYAQRHGARCELWANGIGHLRVRLLRLLCSRALSGCAHIGVRDVKSAYAVMSLTRGACVLPELEDDLAVYTEPSSDERRELLLSRYLRCSEDAFVIVAVNGAMARDKKDRAELVRLVRRLCRLRIGGMQFLFVAMHEKQDGELSKALAKRFCGHAVSLSPSDMMAVTKRAHTVLASRFHALFFAASTGTPYEIFGTDPKLYTVCLKNY